MNEQLKYDVIKELYDHKGNKLRAAERLGLSLRQINRLLKVYEEKGKAGFLHGNRNRQPINSLPQELIDKIIYLYGTKYQEWNFRHFQDFLAEKEGIKISYSALYNILTAAGINSPKIQKATKRKRTKERIRKEKKNIEATDIEEAVNYEIALEDAHPRKERSKHFGERVEMDASIHQWFGGRKYALHLAIDHCTGRILGGWFEEEETLQGYYHVLEQILANYGIPYMFFTDNRTVFNYNKDNRKDDEKDVLTQFGYACKSLGIIIETSSISQAKGMIERANQTFQGRLVDELRKENITDIIAANEYLTKVFIPDFNQRFALNPDDFKSVMEDKPTKEKINLTLAILSPRKFDNGSSIHYHNKIYQAYDSHMNLVCIKPKKECLVIKALDGELFVTVEDNIYKLVELKKNADFSPNFDPVVVQTTKPKKVYIPPMSHPWKRASFISQQERAHNFHQYGF